MHELLPVSINCLLCQAPAKKWLRTTNGGVGPKEDFDVYRCTNCFSTVINPIPEILGKYYLDYHWIPRGSSWKRAVKACRNRLEVVNHYVKASASVLDVGAGSGAFVAAAIEAGHLSYAIERDENCRNNIEKLMPGRVVEDLLAFKEINFQPDVVTLWHVFEHIPDPNDFLRQVCKIFPNDIKIIIEVPNGQSWMFNLMRNRWPHLDAPRHVFLPTKLGIEIIAQKNGMQVSSIRNRDSAAWGAFSISHFGNRVGQGRSVQIIRRMVQILLTPLFLLESGDRSTTRTYLLTRGNK